MTGWRRVVWHAWSRTSDAELAEQLHRLVRPQRAGLGSVLAGLALAALHGAGIGFASGVHVAAAGAASWSALRDWSSVPLVPWAGWGALGGAVAVAAILGVAALLASRPLRQATWLDLLAPPVPPDKVMNGLNAAVDAIGKLIGDCDSGFVVFGVVIGLPALVLFLTMTGVVPGGVVGLAIALLIVAGGTLPGVRLASWMMGVGAILAVASGLPGATGHGAALVATCAAIVVGAAATFAFASAIALATRQSGQAWAYRGFLRGRPPLPTTTVEAVRQAVRGDGDEHAEWSRLVRQVDDLQPESQPVASWIELLVHGDWGARQVARCALLALGGEAMDALANRTKSAGPRTVEVMQAIHDDTTARLAPQARHLRCHDCLLRVERLAATTPLGAVAYWGCRGCHQSRRLYHCPAGAVMVLDEDLAHPPIVSGGALTVSWHQHGRLWDFDRVEVRRTGEHALQRFAQEVENDRDEARRRRYGTLPCRITEPSHLTPQSLSLLDDVLGSVGDSGDKA